MMVQNSIIDAISSQAKWRLTVAVLIVALAIEIYFLVFDIPVFKSLIPSYQGIVQNTPVIGQLLARQKSVQFQAQGDLVWEDALEHQNFHSHDSLLTLDHSKAEIAFLDGTALIVDENSLVQLERSDSREAAGKQHLTIKLLRGAIRKSSVKRPRIQIPGASAEFSIPPELDFQIQVGNIRANFTPDSELTVIAIPGENSAAQAQIVVEKGKVELQTPQQVLQVHKGEEAVLSKDQNRVQPAGQNLLSKIENQFKPAIPLLPSPAFKIEAHPETIPKAKPTVPPPPKMIFIPQIEIKPSGSH